MADEIIRNDDDRGTGGVGPLESDLGEARLDELGWVADILRTSWPESATFAEECLEAGHRAAYLARLRQEAAGDWWPQPAPDYLRSLAASARVPLEEILAWARIPSELRLGRAFAESWGRLARVLELNHRQAVLSYRLATARAAGVEPSWLVAARAEVADPAAALASWERAIDRALETASPETLAALRADEAAIRSAYADLAAEDVS
jgi:hypothetical protein